MSDEIEQSLQKWITKKSISLTLQECQLERLKEVVIKFKKKYHTSPSVQDVIRLAVAEFIVRENKKGD